MPLLKNKVTVMAIDDSPHRKEDLHHHRKVSALGTISTTHLIAVVCREYQLLHVSQTEIEIDGTDSTTQIIQLLKSNPHFDEIRLLMIDSPTVGGFNPPNPFKIFNDTQIPVVLIPDRKPQSKIANIYEKIFPERVEQIQFLKNLPPLQEVQVFIQSDPNIQATIHFHAIGIELSDLIPLLKHLTFYSGIPEPLRLAHLIASKANIEKKTD